MNNLTRRLFSAAFLIPIVLFVVWVGHYFSILALILVASVSAWEWGQIIQNKPSFRLPEMILILFPNLIALLFIFGFSSIGLGMAAFSVVLLLFTASQHKISYICGIFIITAVFMALYTVREKDSNGFILILWLFFLTWMMDSGAYFVGRYFKGPRLAPRISPNKTWSGLGGGLAAVFIVAFVFDIVLELNILTFYVFTLVTALIGHVGDLIESAFKRHFNVKDSSQIIPGHGGLMDRIDSLAISACFVALVMYFYDSPSLLEMFR